jgi:hypothetical protein
VNAEKSTLHQLERMKYSHVREEAYWSVWLIIEPSTLKMDRRGNRQVAILVCDF